MKIRNSNLQYQGLSCFNHLSHDKLAVTYLWRVLMDLVKELVKPLFNYLRAVPVKWKGSSWRRVANVIPSYKKGHKEDLAAWLCCQGRSWNIWHWALSHSTYRTIRPSHYVFVKDRSWLTNLISIYGKLTHSVGDGKVDGVHLDFSKSLDAVSQHAGETGCPVCWVKKLAGSSDPEKGWVVPHPAGGWSPVVFPRAPCCGCKAEGVSSSGGGDFKVSSNPNRSLILY